MKHIKHYSIFESNELDHPGFPETEEEIHRLCKFYKINNYTINEDLSIDVDGIVSIQSIGLEYLPLNFNYINQSFLCNDNKLKSLKGCPNEVGYSVNCSNNNLETLEGLAQKIGLNLKCNDNNLVSLKGCPEVIHGDFNCSYNILKTLKNGPKNVGGYYDCSYNELESLEYISKEIGYTLSVDYNIISDLKHFPNVKSNIFSFRINPINPITIVILNKDNYKELIQEFNDYSIIRGNIIIRNRLKAFINDFDLEMPSILEIKENYTII